MSLCGRVSHQSLLDGAPPVAPSAIKPEGKAWTPVGQVDFVLPRALGLGETTGIVDQSCLRPAFGRAVVVRLCKKNPAARRGNGTGCIVGSSHDSDIFGAKCTDKDPTKRGQPSFGVDYVTLCAGLLRKLDRGRNAV